MFYVFWDFMNLYLGLQQIGSFGKATSNQLVQCQLATIDRVVEMREHATNPKPGTVSLAMPSRTLH